MTRESKYPSIPPEGWKCDIHFCEECGDCMGCHQEDGCEHAKDGKHWCAWWEKDNEEAKRDA